MPFSVAILTDMRLCFNAGAYRTSFSFMLRLLPRDQASIFTSPFPMAFTAVSLPR